MSSIAPASTGRPALRKFSTVRMVKLSISSRVAGTMWPAMMEATAWEASMTLSKTAIMALKAAGGGTSFRVSFSKTPRVPSEAIIRPARL